MLNCKLSFLNSEDQNICEFMSKIEHNFFLKLKGLQYDTFLKYIVTRAFDNIIEDDKNKEELISEKIIHMTTSKNNNFRNTVLNGRNRSILDTNKYNITLHVLKKNEEFEEKVKEKNFKEIYKNIKDYKVLEISLKEKNDPNVEEENEKNEIIIEKENNNEQENNKEKEEIKEKDKENIIESIPSELK